MRYKETAGRSFFLIRTDEKSIKTLKVSSLLVPALLAMAVSSSFSQENPRDRLSGVNRDQVLPRRNRSCFNRTPFPDLRKGNVLCPQIFML
jgi:hypothetical protein